MTPTRRTFFASLAALVVAPKVLKPDLVDNDRIDIYALSDHPHLDAANRIAWLRHIREHKLAMKRVSGTQWIEDGRW